MHRRLKAKNCSLSIIFVVVKLADWLTDLKIFFIVFDFAVVGAKMDKTPCKVELRLNLACWCLTEKKIVEILLFVGDNEQVAHSV